MIRYIAGGAATASLVAFFGLYSDLPDADASGKAKRGEAAMMVVGGPPATGPDGLGAATGALSAAHRSGRHPIRPGRAIHVGMRRLPYGLPGGTFAGALLAGDHGEPRRPFR